MNLPAIVICLIVGVLKWHFDFAGLDLFLVFAVIVLAINNFEIGKKINILQEEIESLKNKSINS